MFFFAWVNVSQPLFRAPHAFPQGDEREVFWCFDGLLVGLFIRKQGFFNYQFRAFVASFAR